AEEHPVAEADAGRDLGDRDLAHDLGAGHRQLAFLQRREPLHQHVAGGQAERGVAEELESLVVGHARVRVLVQERLVRQRVLEELAVLERIPQLRLEKLVASRLHRDLVYHGATMHLCCLKCTSILDKAQVEEVEVDVCPACGGLWLDHGEIERISRKMGSEIDRLRRLLAPQPGPPAVPSDVTTSCPRCTGSMKEVTLGNIRIDFC